MNIKIDQLIRSHRKTIGLQITRDARLIVRAPYRASEEYIKKLVQQKTSWIKSKQEYLRQRPCIQRKFIPGEEFLFLGQRYLLTAVEDLPRAVVLDQSLMIARVVVNNAKDHLENWYKTQALDYLRQRVDCFAQLTGLKYESIKINAASTRWGSCGHGNSLNFCWRLIMAPVSVIDYVVVHELMHIKQKNHSRKFWSEVQQVLPDYKLQERWLKLNGHLLSWSE